MKTNKIEELKATDHVYPSHFAVNEHEMYHTERGMTLRQYYIGQAIEGCATHKLRHTPKEIINFVDIMIKEERETLLIKGKQSFE